MLRRIKRMPAEKVVRSAAILSVVLFLLWLGVTLLIWQFADPKAGEFNLWSAMEGLSSVAILALTIGGGAVVLVQINESIDSRNVETFTRVFEKLMSREQEAARRWIYQEMPPFTEAGLDALTSEGRTYIRLVLNTFDYLGFLVQQEWVTEEAAESIVEWISPVMVKTWAKLEPYVDDQCNKRREKDYYLDARRLAERCRAWRKKHYPDAPIIWLDQAL
jgi:hypothetical protein